MKKLIYLFSALALFACEKAEDFDQPNQGGTASGELPEVIYATVADDDSEGKTRTVVAKDGNSILWNTGDAVSAFFSGISNAQYQYDGEDSVATAEFKRSMIGHTGMELSRSYAVYPYHDDNTSVLEGDAEKLKVNFPAEQTFAANSFGRGASVMVGVGETANDTDFYFRNACGYLVIKLKGEGVTVKSITLTALGGEKIAGTGLITASHGADPVVAMTEEGSSTITLNCGEGVALGADATEFWFAMPPVTFSDGLKIHVVPTSGLAFEMQTSNQVEITRNDIQPMAALQYTPNTQLPNQFVYTRSDGSTDPIEFHENVGNYPFNVNASIKAHYYDGEKFIIECNAPITGINAYAFYQKQLATVSFPNQLKTIGDFAFYGTYLQELVFPGSVTLSGKSAFRGCSSLTTITFLWGEEELELREDDGGGASNYGPFYNSPLESLYIDRNLRYRDEEGDVMDMSNHGLFRHYPHDDNAHPVVFGPNVTIITDNMFCNLLLQPQFVIPGNINHIGKDAFIHRSELTELTFEPSPTNTPLTIDCSKEFSPFFVMVDGNDKLTKISLNRELVNTLKDPNSVIEGVFGNRPALKTVVLGEQVKTISDYMFAGRTALTSVTLPEGLTTIGNNAFEGCTALTSVNVPSTVTTIGNSAFEDCDGLTSATINSSTLGSNMFDGCNNLATVTIGGTLDAINVDAFSGCSKLSTLNISGSVGSIGDGAFDGFNLTSLNISGHVGTIGANAFDDNDKMTSFTVTGSVGTIGVSAFEDSDKLATVSITGTVDRVCSYAFSDCDAVITLAIRANVVEAYAYEDMDGLTSATLYGATVGSHVFYDCDALQTLVIDGSVNEIGNDAFDDCSKLTSVTFEGSSTNLRLGFQDGTLSDKGPFYDSPLTYINLNRQIDYIYDNLDATDEGVFSNVNTSTPATVVLGENVKAIHNWMFYGVPISTLTIPASINAIGKEAFGGNSRLTTITCKGSTPATLDSAPFPSSVTAIYVPVGAVDEYQLFWGEYSNKITRR